MLPLPSLSHPSEARAIEMETFFEFQIDGAGWLAEKTFALLADEMGLGKSAQCVLAADIVGAERICVVCPASLRDQWQREFEKFSLTPRNFDVDYRPGIRKAQCRSTVRILSFDTARLAGPLLKELEPPFDVLIVDEAHALKNHEAKQTLGVLGKEGLAHHAKRIWLLSGTPAPNHAGELWTLLYSFGVTRLGYLAFVERYCTARATAHGPQITGTKLEMIAELRLLLKPIMLRRMKEDVMKDLPPIRFTDIAVPAGPVDVEICFPEYWPNRIPELEEKLARELGMIDGVMKLSGPLSTATFKTLEAMADSVSTLRRYTGLQKIQAVADLVGDELRNNAYEKIILFCIHRDVIEGLRQKLREFHPVTFYGGHPPETKRKNELTFKNNKKCRVFIGNIRAAGVGLTLNVANHILFVEQEWTPGHNAQAAMRCHRIGQTKAVLVRFAGMAGSIDEKISQALKRKTRELSEIFNVEGLQKEMEALSVNGSSECVGGENTVPSSDGVAQ